MKYYLREYHSLILQSIIGKKKLKLKDVITSSICTIVDRTCYIFFLHCGLTTGMKSKALTAVDVHVAVYDAV
jgi:hypothetical protein